MPHEIIVAEAEWMQMKRDIADLDKRLVNVEVLQAQQQVAVIAAIDALGELFNAKLHPVGETVNKLETRIWTVMGGVAASVLSSVVTYFVK